MSLFNDEYRELKRQKDLYLEDVIENKIRRERYLLGKFIFENNYSQIFKDKNGLDDIKASLNPDYWSIPMNNFIASLRQYMYDRVSLEQIQRDLIRIPIENMHERLNAALEFFKGTIIKRDSIKYSNIALSFLNSTIENFLDTNPSLDELNYYNSKIEFINDMILNLNIIDKPKVKELIHILDQITYKFTHRDNEDKLKYSTPVEVASENTVASIAPIIGNAAVKFNTNPCELVFEPEFLVDKGYISHDMIGNYADFMCEVNYQMLHSEDVKEAIEKAKTTAAKVGSNVSAVGGRVVRAGKRIGKEAIRRGDEGFAAFKAKLLKREKRTEDALKNSPYLDQKLSSLFKDAMINLTSFLATGGLGGLLSAIYLKYKYNKEISEERSRLKARLKEEIIIVDEKIKDYESSGDKEVKYALMRIKMKMAKAIEALDTNRSVEITNDADLKHFTVDEKRLVRKGRIEKARQERIGREYDSDNDNRYDN